MSKYDESSIQVLKGLEGVRKKPGMYIGLVDDLGVWTILREVLDNAVDNYHMDSKYDSVTVRLRRDGYSEVHDNGPGIPVGRHKTADMSTFQAVTSLLHAGGKMDSSSDYGATVGTHGIGLKATVALSESFTAFTHRDGRWHEIEYRKGRLKGAVSKSSAKRVMGVTGADPIHKRGTIVVHKPDMSVFDKGSRLRIKHVTEWAETTTYLSPGFKVVLEAEGRDGKARRKTFSHPGGVSDWVRDQVAELDCATMAKEPLRIKGDNIDLVLAFTDSERAEVRGYCNGLHQVDGGTHVNAVLSTLFASLKPYAKDKDSFIRQDLEEGLLGLVNFKVGSPVFSSQSKEKLVDKRFNDLCRSVLADGFAAYWKAHRKLAGDVCRRAAAMQAARSEFAALKKSAHELKRKTKDLTKMPDKLATANCSPDERELFIVEGDSAGGTAKGARLKDPYRFQETLPIRGKLTNAYKEKVERVLANDSAQSILSAIGYDPSLEDPLSKLRVARVVLLSDPDPDGEHINCLLLSLLAVYVPELFDRGMVYTVLSPKYMLTDRGRQWFGMSVDEIRDQLPKGVNPDKITYVKGWGECSPSSMRMVAFDPATRRISRTRKPSQKELVNVARVMGFDTQWRKRLLGIAA